MPVKRLTAISVALGFVMMLCLGRLLLISQNEVYSDSAIRQRVNNLTITQERGKIYDRNGNALTETEEETYLLCVPGDSSYDKLYSAVSGSDQEALYARRNSTTPFLLKVSVGIQAENTYRCTGYQRYSPLPSAEHLIGYLDSEGHGVSGVEKAWDSILFESGTKQIVQCITTAQGTLLEGTTPKRIVEAGDGASVWLALDAGIQRACEGIASECMTTGCILVLSSPEAQVLADVSLPHFDPENIGKSIAANDTSLIDRTFSAFNVGSVFKPVLAAAALENNLSWFRWDCVGAVEIDGQVYRCAKGIAHGDTDISLGLEQSCNCFFIKLGQRLGGERILNAARKLGFGTAISLAEGTTASAGNLPDEATLRNSGQLANFSFGQGKLTATPIQIAAMMNCIASGGIYTAPAFWLKVQKGNGLTGVERKVPSSKRVLSQETAELLQIMLAGVVEDGIGKQAQNEHETTAGKTGTAQTGRLGKSGEELMDYWFAGFYPAENPRYTIVVLQDSVELPETSCAAVFSRICTILSLLENS